MEWVRIKELSRGQFKFLDEYDKDGMYKSTWPNICGAES